jgi:universal stress protein E
MQLINSILVVVDSSPTAADAVAKGVILARRFKARIELFMCDAERAYALSRAYVPCGVDDACQLGIRQMREALERLIESAAAPDVQMTCDAVCESPRYRSIVAKVIRTRPDLVIKNVAGTAPQGSGFDVTDWQLMRACPATLMLTRGRPWSQVPQFAAAVDVSASESTELVRSILRTACRIVDGADGQLDMVYAEPATLSADGRAEGLRALQRLRAEFPGLDHRVHVLVGDPEVSLPRFARSRNFDAVLLGALSHAPGPAVQVGSLTSKLLDALECDFVLVKPRHYRSPACDALIRPREVSLHDGLN